MIKYFLRGCFYGSLILGGVLTLAACSAPHTHETDGSIKPDPEWAYKTIDAEAGVYQVNHQGDYGNIALRVAKLRKEVCFDIDAVQQAGRFGRTFVYLDRSCFENVYVEGLEIGKE